MRRWFPCTHVRTSARTHLLACACTAFAACAQPSPAPQPSSAVTVNAPVAKTWTALVDVLGDRNVSITAIDRSSGIITAKSAELSRGDFLQLANCGSFTHQALIGGIGSGVARYNAVVRGDSTRASIKVTATYTGHTNHGADETCVSTGAWETALATDVKTRAEARAGATSPSSNGPD